MSKFEISDGDDPRLYEDGRYVGVLDLPAEQAARIVRLLNEREADRRRLDWLETHEIPSDSPRATFALGDTAKFPWGAARLEEEIPNGFRWTKVDWREALDAAIAAQPASKEQG